MRPLPFPISTRFAHFITFFAQTWLIAKIFLAEQKHVPYKKLLIFALLFAFFSEWAQATFTTTREGSLGDGIADMLGTMAALWFAKKVETAKLQNQKPI